MKQVIGGLLLVVVLGIVGCSSGNSPESPMGAPFSSQCTVQRYIVDHIVQGGDTQEWNPVVVITDTGNNPLPIDIVTVAVFSGGQQIASTQIVPEFSVPAFVAPGASVTFSIVQDGSYITRPSATCKVENLS